MIRKLTSVISFSLLTVLCFGQTHDSAWTKEIRLPESGYIKPEKRIPLVETDTFIVYSTFDIIVENIKKFIEEYDVEDDKRLLDKFFNSAKALDRSLFEIQSDAVLKSRLNFRTAELIQKRKCLIYNKVSKIFESKLLVTNYIKNWWTGIQFSTHTNQVIMDLRTGAF